MNFTHMTVEDLAQLLRDTAQAHHLYEESLGHNDPDWPRWYAEYMIKKFTGMDDDQPTQQLPRPVSDSTTGTD